MYRYDGKNDRRYFIPFPLSPSPSILAPAYFIHTNYLTTQPPDSTIGYLSDPRIQHNTWLQDFGLKMRQRFVTLPTTTTTKTTHNHYHSFYPYTTQHSLTTRNRPTPFTQRTTNNPPTTITVLTTTKAISLMHTRPRSFVLTPDSFLFHPTQATLSTHMNYPRCDTLQAKYVRAEVEKHV